jgi:hypothetical protein
VLGAIVTTIDEPSKSAPVTCDPQKKFALTGSMQIALRFQRTPNDAKTIISVAGMVRVPSGTTKVAPCPK